ncbi:hypothetical protein [Bacillus sp. JJ1562]|uniref:hypothetical protein n=1 Tax=Bacillus sp. JJ1562 TaxID=3122960 RepID=UPI003002D7D3
MRTIVYTDPKKTNLTIKKGKISIVESEDHVTEEPETIVMNKENYHASHNRLDKVYIPSTLLESVTENVHVFFELEQYPFFRKIKETITDKKGVLRFRRKIGKKDIEKLVASDLYMFSSILGDPQTIRVKYSDRSIEPYHIIVTVDYKEQAMAHLEYTVCDSEEQIELEWSGIKQIIEFNSEEMNPLQPKKYTTLSYTIDSIISNARKADQDMVNQLHAYTQLVFGGANE